MTQDQANFEGWAVLELFGHSREAGHVTTAYFGTAAMFRVDVPELPEREITLLRPEWIRDKDAPGGEVMAPAGSKISRAAIPGRTRFISPGAVYALNPCDEAGAFKAIETMVHRDVKIIELAPKPNQLTTGEATPICDHQSKPQHRDRAGNLRCECGEIVDDPEQNPDNPIKVYHEPPDDEEDEEDGEQLPAATAPPHVTYR